MPAEWIQSVKSRYPTQRILGHNLLPTEVSVDFSDFSSNFKSHNNALALAGLNFDRLSQRWDNNDRRSARLRGGSVSPRQPGFPRNTDRHLRFEILYFPFFLHFFGASSFPRKLTLSLEIYFCTFQDQPPNIIGTR